MTGTEEQDEPGEMRNGVPTLMVQQAEAAALAAREDDDESPQGHRHAGHDVPTQSAVDVRDNSSRRGRGPSGDTTASADIEPPEHDVPPPAYGDHYGQIQEEQEGFGTKATVAEDGRVDIRIDQRTKKIASLLGPALQQQQELAEEEEPLPPAYIPPSLGGAEGVPPPPPMNVAIHVVGSRGDVQPFVALGKVLKDTYGHRVRLATHPNFKDFVTENGLEFFSIGGDPAKLMAFMVKNPGLMPGMDSLRSGDIGERRGEVRQMLKGCWRSCYEAGDGLGPAATDNTVEDWSRNPVSVAESEANRPFVADAIIANPPSFAHIHVAEKMGIPLHIMFTMPYSATQAFPHPLANIQSSNADPNLTNYISYTLIEMLTWQGLGDVINNFRKFSLGLDEIGMWSPLVLQRLKIPHTYCWSPALIPKPNDWRQHISISGFFFLNLASNYRPPSDLAEFLDSGPPPVYIGFGSIVLDDPNAMTKLIFEAVRKTGQRALVSKGWGGMGADELGMPDGVFMLGNCPHDWLFKHVSCVVHHGGAGTTAAGISAGKPTVVVPFFGDQPWWGSMVARAGAGPDPLPHKALTADKLAKAIEFCLTPQSQERAKELASKIAQEKGTDLGAQSFHQYLDTDKLRCSLAPSRAAVWRIKRTDVRLSAMAACTLANEGILDFKELKLFRPREYEADTGPLEPISGGAASIIGTTSSIMGGVMDMPIGTFNAINQRQTKRKEAAKEAERAKKEEDESKNGQEAKKGGDAAEHPGSNDASSTRKSTVSDDAAIGTGQSTPATSRQGSSFNLEESLSRISSPLSPLGSPGSTRGSVSSSSAANTGEPPSQDGRAPSTKKQNSFDAMKHLETAKGTGKGLNKIIGAGFKSPMDFTDSLARGFHNAPKLYGDDTVRKSEKITDFRSGVMAASKEFGLGMFDGITGLVTQPMKGMQKEGAAGFIKGIGKGVGGIVLKPGAAIFGIPGYTMKGVYKEMLNALGSSVQNYIIAARTAQGYDEWNRSSPAEREDVVMRFARLGKQLKKKKSPEELVRSIMGEQRQKRDPKGGKDSGTLFVSRDREDAMLSAGAQENRPRPASSAPPAAPSADAELEEAIRLSVRETSRGDVDEDAEVERAIRASMAEHARSRGAANASDEDSEALRKAMAASLADAEDAKTKGKHATTDHDDDLEKALAASLREQRRLHADNGEWDSDPGTEHDEEYRRAINASQGRAGDAPPPYEEELGGKTASPDQKTHQERSEEQVVMEYVKKQSLLEQQHRKGTSQGAGESSSSAAAGLDEDEDVKKAIEMSMRDEKGRPAQN